MSLATPFDKTKKSVVLKQQFFNQNKKNINNNNKKNTMAPAKKAGNKKFKGTNPKGRKVATKSTAVAPGTVAIMLAGRFRGRHCVVLKNVDAADKQTLIVSGPYKYNGIPLRRVNRRYIIATSTKVDLSGAASVLDKVDKKTFARAKAEKKAKSAAGFLGRKEARAATAGKKKIPDERVALQKQVDAAIIAAVKKDKNGKVLPGYLRSVFTVKPGDAPHRMKF